LNKEADRTLYVQNCPSSWYSYIDSSFFASFELIWSLAKIWL